MSQMKSILVVEDDNDMRRRICNFLVKKGFNVLEAENGKIGLNKTKLQRPDLILSDIKMPEMDGFEFLEAIKYDDSINSIPFIFLTVINEIQVQVNSGAQEWFIKPFNFKILLKSIERQLLLSSMHKQLELKNYDLQIALTKKVKIIDLVKKFTEMVTHDMYNALAISTGNSELLSLNIEDPNMKKHLDALQKSLERIRNDAEHLRKEINTENQKKLQNLEILASQVVDFNLMAARLKNQKIDFKKVDKCIVMGNSHDLMSAIDNLVSNAIKFSNEKKTIWVSLDKDSASVIFIVGDEGMGLTKEQIKKVYTDPGNVGNTPTGGEESHGLGLTIVRFIIEDHNGELIIESEPGKGSTFTMKLPLAKDE